MKGILLVLFLSVVTGFAEDSFEENTQRIAWKVLNDCLVKDEFSMCLKMKGIVLLERLGRVKQFSLTDSVAVVRFSDMPGNESSITEQQLEKILPRSADAKSDALNNMLAEKLGSFLTSRRLKVSPPKTFEEEEEEQHVVKKKKKKDHSKLIFLLFGAKAYAIASVIMAATFLIAKKALIIGKIALVIAAIIGLKKFLPVKRDVSVDYDHGHYGIGGWDSDWHGGGWANRVNNGQDLAYNSYSPKK